MNRAKLMKLLAEVEDMHDQTNELQFHAQKLHARTITMRTLIRELLAKEKETI